MSVSILTSKFSFYTFDGSDVIDGCGFAPFRMCLPVYLDNDVAFQFKLVTTTKGEADALCDLDNDFIEIGIVQNCIDDFLLKFSQKTVRYRINDNTLLYNWNNGLPGFTSVISNGECFHIKIRVNGTDTFCSNCLVRVNEDCYTNVIDYNNNSDAFDFDYCGGSLVGSTTDQDCEPMIITFTNIATLNLPYTTSLQQKYGDIPTVQTWIYNNVGELVDMGIEITFDEFPPSVIGFDFGGVSSGVIKIS